MAIWKYKPPFQEPVVIEMTLYNTLLALSFLFAGITFVALSFIDAPYGRHTRHDFGPLISNRLGWFFMETPAALVFAILFGIGQTPKEIPLAIFFLMWESHYVHRAFVYPFRIADGRKKMPLAIALLGFVFNIGNAYLNGRYLFSLPSGYTLYWLLDPCFVIGVTLFVTGYALNRWADRKLRQLRGPGEIDYKIPFGGLYEWVSCPNYLGEIIEWIGWAIATWSVPGLAFAVWTFANLAPRARAHHIWYKTHFAEYPAKRKALVPKVW